MMRIRSPHRRRMFLISARTAPMEDPERLRSRSRARNCIVFCRCSNDTPVRDPCRKCRPNRGSYQMFAGFAQEGCDRAGLAFAYIRLGLSRYSPRIVVDESRQSTRGTSSTALTNDISRGRFDLRRFVGFHERIMSCELYEVRRLHNRE